MAVIYTPHFIQFNDDDGNPLSGGKLYTYAAGTTTPQATYTDAGGLTPNANPVVLDSSGRATVFLSGSYKFRLEDSLGNLIEETDNITAFATGESGVDDIVANFTEDVITASDSIIFSDASDGNSTKRDTVQGILDFVDFNRPFLHLQDQKASGTAGGTFTSGAWQTRTLNTEVTDTIGSTLSSNQFTLPAGTYYIEALAPAVNCSSHQARIQNITDASTALLGQNNFVGSNAGGSASVSGFITLSGSKTFELQNRCSLTRATDGFGAAGSWGTEVYSEVRVWKVT